MKVVISTKGRFWPTSELVEYLYKAGSQFIKSYDSEELDHIDPYRATKTVEADGKFWAINPAWINSILFRASSILLEAVEALPHYQDYYKVVDVPDDVDVIITCHNRTEAIEERHRTWR